MEPQNPGFHSSAPTEEAGVGTLLDRLAAASWFCWAVPLLINEAILQGRKIFSVRSPHAI